MVDPEVERQYADTKELLVLWQEFYEYFEMAKKGENLTPDKEEAFLDLKSKIAMLHDSFMDALTHDQNIGQNVLDIVTRSISLKHLNRQNIADIKKMEIEWHESYLLLNETVAMLEEKRQQLASMSEAQYRAQKAAGLAQQRVHAILTSIYLKIAIILVAVAFGTVGVQVLGIFDWNSLANYPIFHSPYRVGKKIYRAINPNSPWPNIAVADGDRAAPSSTRWIGKPEVKSDPKDNVLKLEPLKASGIAGILNKATEYRKEEVTQKFDKAEIHTFLLPQTSDALAVEQKWNDYVSKNRQLESKFRIVRNVNVITIITGTNDGLINDIKVKVYDQL
ncbi:MAG: hypothetical protein N2Z21_05995 [Candidatus Sumerlaeaceae bacterium]|nr:hypothetical protein [Candidatus Sumerlaeaceae bacterium]